MWQTVAVLLLIAGILVYVVRHYAGLLRGDVPVCCDCSGCCAASSDSECDKNDGKILEKKNPA